jgi:hypothetical protein
MSQQKMTCATLLPKLVVELSFDYNGTFWVLAPKVGLTQQ